VTHHRRQVVTVLIILCIVGIIVAWEKYIQFQIFPKNFGVVEAGQIYRSGELSSRLVERILRRYNIKVIVCLTGNDGGSNDKAEEDAVTKLGIEKKIFLLRGNGTGDINNYAKAIDAIFQANKRGLPVLVRCAAGTQRTGGVIAAYRLLVEKKDVPFVVNEMESFGWRSESNPALLLYLNSNMKELASLLYQMKIIDEIPDPLPQITTDGE
jgi:hypothetical protein